MRISYNWLKEYVDLKLPPEKLAELLTMAGLSVESVERLGSDNVLEIEITANRPDWLSVIGVAREVAALTGAKLTVPWLGDRESSNESRSASHERQATVSVDEPGLCGRYTARIIRNVKVAESPAWLKARIEAMGLRPVNNIVDITNFCLFETGEPMHAFDLDKLSGNAVVVRKARAGEKLIVIEGAEKALDNTVLVIADKERPVAVAGIMGGLASEVTAATRNILLEAAYFDPISVRRTGRKLGLSTESSYRFERRVDPDAIVPASGRALSLIIECAGGQAGEFIDIGAKAEKKRVVELRYSRANSVLGTEIPPEAIQKIVESLGMRTVSSSKDLLTVEIPGFRNDIRAEIDVIEEVSRVYGYDKIPATIPVIVEQPTRVEKDFVVRGRVRAVCAALGLDEIITYSLLSRKTIACAALLSDAVVDVQNPLSAEQEAMRPSLIPGILGAVVWNINRKAKDLKLFEIGNVYRKKQDGAFDEKRHLSVAIAGEIFSGWQGNNRGADFYELKGIVEALFAELRIVGAGYAHTKHESLDPSESAGIEIGGKLVGVAGLVRSRVLGQFDIKEKVYILELDLDALLGNVDLDRHFEELSKYPSVSRDISIVAAKDILNADIIGCIKGAGGRMLKEVKLIDRYEGRQVPEGKVSLTYRLEYSDPARTLEEKDVSQIHERVLGEVERKFGARLR